MLKRNTLLLLFSSTLYFSTIPAIASPEQSLTNDINQLLKTMGRNAHTGIFVQSMKTKRIIYTKNADALFTPASVMKVLTTTAALLYLKPNYCFKTELFSDGKIQNKQLKGNLFLKLNGDPSFNSKNLTQLLKQIKKHKINHINGNIYIDTTAYNNVPYPPGWLWDDLSYNYAAPLNTLIMNENKFTLSFLPSSIPGRRPTLTNKLPSNTIWINNQLTTTTSYNIHCPLAIYSDQHNHYLLKGCLLQQYGDQHRSLAIRNPLRVFRAQIKSTLDKLHITLGGKIYIKKMRSDATLLAIHQSKPLKQLIIHLLKTSDNLYADTLVKKIGEHYYKRTGSWQNGLRAMKKVIQQTIHINTKNIRINDGAGLSRYNLLSPSALGQLLYYIDHHKALRNIIRHALPIAGRDGTLKNRMHRLAKNNRLLAKTGTMTSASTLAGFIDSKHHGRLSFTIMINGYVGSKKPFQQLENKIGERLSEF